MKDITKIGLDTAKSVFQVHGIIACGEVVVRGQLKRRQGELGSLTWLWMPRCYWQYREGANNALQK